MTRILPATVKKFVFVCLFLAVCASTVAAQAPASLYKRLGGYDAIAAVTDEFISRLGSDKQLSRFLVGLSTDSQKRLASAGSRSAMRRHGRTLHLYRS